ncbi:helix-turn-helix domain-containing protein [Pontimicrobium aquaticum]|uniref:Helix-turn-helix transcriptional regulator n=1 Tax=Pontimicrobium aquaticum TaxID=2565367 RepID=A0A4U0EUA9_9FLAO|nr:AraC family transcriptional regulator [Pontimicrobium aquaticum]TJY33982.1 helix-turn-helix transcriptional regulator [Pontimicrobium aquaticum]
MKLIIDFILIVGIVLNIITLLKLFKTKNNQLPKKILIIFWFFILFILIHFYGLLHKLNFLLIPTFLLENGSRLILAVLIYLYVKSLFENEKNFIVKYFAHLMPFVLYVFLYTLPSSLNYATGKNIFPYIQIINTYINLALIKDFYGLIYLLLSLNVYNKYEPRLKQFFSSFKEEDFIWIKKFIMLFLVAISVDLIITISEIYFGYNVEWDAYITLFFVIIAMSYLGYFGLTQKTMFLTEIILDQPTLVKGDYNQKIINQKEENELTLKLEKLFNEDKVHLQSDLNLNDLSQKLQISSRKLSAFLNDDLYTNFYEKVNYHRVEEAKNMLATDKVLQYKITAIGELCGFNSKSSFYRIFKKSTGYSPSEYRRFFLKK